MAVNNVNNSSGAVWNDRVAVGRLEKVDFTNALKPAKLDKFELNLPTTETIYERKEFVTNETMSEDCAFCYTYMERKLTFADGKGGNLTIISGKSDGVWQLNMKGSERTFGKSGVNMTEIGNAVEETWERRERSVEQCTISGSLPGAVTVNGSKVGGALGFAVQSTLYKYSSASATKGTVTYKNGAAGNYRETASSSRELYNKCAVFLAEAFGENSSELVLGEDTYNELFGKLGGDEKTFTVNMAQRREKLDKQLNRLKEFMDKHLSAVRRKDPDNKSLRTFADTYLKLSTYDISDLTSLVEKIFAAEKSVNAEK